MTSDVPGSQTAESPLLIHLNPQQRAAVTLWDVHALVLAGAGSGKTRVLTTRMAWLLQQGAVSPAGLLAVTFTNKAAKEMLARLGALLPVSVRGRWVGTFRGLCNRMLRAHHQTVGLPQNFQILDTQDQLSALKRLYKQHGLDDTRDPPKQVLWFIAGCKEDGIRADQVVGKDPETRRRAEIYRLYDAQCQREGVVDFGELMLRCYELLRDQPAIRRHYQRRFRYLLVDEFQDTNRLQYAWIKLLAGLGEPAGGAWVMAVGDDDQSIYAFRGARVGNMADFVREFGVERPIKLEENYRSGSHILDCANGLIDHNDQRLGKTLRTQQGPGEPVRCMEAVDDFHEAQWLVEQVRQLQAENWPLHEMAVLYRSNAQSRVLETALFNAAIPYKVYGGLRFFERAEIKHALAYLRLLVNPKDDTSFLRVVNFPPRGIGARSLEQLQDAARSAQCALVEAVSLLPARAATAVGAFVAGLDVLREHVQGLSLRAVVAATLEQSGLLAHYRAERDGEDRVANLEELLNAAEGFLSAEGLARDAAALQADAATSPPQPDRPTPAGVLDPDTGETVSPLLAFLTHAALEAGDNQAQPGQDAVQLMTVHASKGLEFDAVFITGLEEGLFPHDNALSDRNSLEEERRLMYVAITRARKRLSLSHAQSRMLHGQTRYNLPSRFLQELPQHALKWLTAGRQRDRSSRSDASFSGALDPQFKRAEDIFSPAKPVLHAMAGAPGFRVGQAVFHNKFGEGRVLALEGQGTDARAHIRFARHGDKWLALSVAKLTAVS